MRCRHGYKHSLRSDWPEQIYFYLFGPHIVTSNMAMSRNSRGFAALPTELLHHVVSYIQGTTIPWHQSYPSEGQRDERRDVLRALCQLCRSLHAALLPLVWQSLDAYTLIQGSGRNQIKALRKELIGQLRLVSDVTQPYASYIR